MKHSLGARARRFIFATVAVLLGCEIFYVVVMNVFLSTALFERFINATPDVVDIHYRRGWSLFPTRVHAKDLDIRATDGHLEWILHFDDVVFECSLIDLARQQFHATMARGDGITFRARLKLEAPAATREHLRGLPPIDSLGALGLVPSDPPYPGKWDDAKWHLWTVRIDDAIAEHVREVWVQRARFLGDARVAGSFLLKPMRAAEVGPAHVNVRNGRVELQARTIAEPLTATIDFKLDRFDPRVASGADIVHHITLSVDARTRVPELDDLTLVLPRSGQVRGALDVPRLAVRLANGILQNETQLEAHADDLLVTDAKHAIRGGLGIDAKIADGKLGVVATVDRLDGDFVLEIPRATLSADSAALDLAQPFADLHGSIDVPDAVLPQVTALADYLPKPLPFRITHGTLHAAVRAEAWRATKRARGDVRLRAEAIEVIAGKLRARADAKAEASVADWDLAAGAVGGDVELDLADVSGALEGRAERLFSIDRVHANVSASHFRLAHPSLESVAYALHVHQIEVPDAHALGALAAPSKSFELESGKLLAAVDLASATPARAAGGVIEVSLSQGGVRMGESHLTGNVSLTATMKGLDTRPGNLDLQGSHVALRDVRVTGASTNTSGWSGDVLLSRGALTVGAAPRFDGTVTLKARDASPILAVIFRDTLPKVLAPLANMPSFAATTDVSVGSGNLVVSNLVAGGGELSVRGTYADRSGDGRGAFVVSEGPVSVGINLDSQGPHVRLFGLQTWYDDLARQALVPASGGGKAQ